MKRTFKLVSVLMAITLLQFGCQKESTFQEPVLLESAPQSLSANAATPPFNIEVILRGENNAFGHIKFRQDNDEEKIITLDVWLRDLIPNREYLLQRAVDAAGITDGICTSTSWLTLGKGTAPQSIVTDSRGMAREQLWRSVAAVASGTAFDIHFRVVDAATMAVVLTSDCYQYVVR